MSLPGISRRLSVVPLAGVDPWVVEVLRWGYHVPFQSVLPLSVEPIPFPSYGPNSIRGKALEEEVQALLKKGAIELTPLTSRAFTAIFL